MLHLSSHTPDVDAVHAGGGVQASHCNFPKLVFGHLKKKKQLLS